MSASNYDVEKQEAQTPERAERTRPERVYVPRVDIVEENDAIELVADMPGVDETSVEITLEENVLTLRGRVDLEIPEGYHATYAEYGIGDYERVFTLSEEIDQAGIEAAVKQGVLTLSLPKVQPEPARKIPVKAAT
jgi:HSP20 family molecular chaperone IbpA